MVPSPALKDFTARERDAWCQTKQTEHLEGMPTAAWRKDGDRGQSSVWEVSGGMEGRRTEQHSGQEKQRAARGTAW